MCHIVKASNKLHFGALQHSNNLKEFCSINLRESCSLVVKAGFNSQLIRVRAWSKVREPATIKVYTQKNLNMSIVISISQKMKLKKTEAALIKKEFA